MSAGSPNAPLVSIIMGSDSDLLQMAEAARILEGFEIPFEITIVSAHRTPERLFSFAKSAAGRGIKTIIAGAGGAAHLPGMVASMTTLPVIGVPIKTSTLNGQDSLLSIVQMPRGIPVATVAIGNAANAGLLAVRILACSNKDLSLQLENFHQEEEQRVLNRAQKLESVGFEDYLIHSMPRQL